MSGQAASSAFLRGLLAPFSLVYAGAIGARNLYYDRISSATRGAGIPVISVGNLTVGGTGKTPLTIEIVRRLREAGHQPAILTRGYGARAGEVADEVLEYELAVPGVPVVVNADRVAGAALARADRGADCAVLDDGFQHRRLRRDLDIVLVDALNPWGGGRLLPAGRLREPLRSLRRADWIVVTRINQVAPQLVPKIMEVLRRCAPRARVLKAAVEGDRLVALAGDVEAPARLAEHRVLPVCGIANPRTFLELIACLGGATCPPLTFADHQRYRPADVESIVDAARRRQAEWVVTTRKDWVKLSKLWSSAPQAADRPELWRLDTRMLLADPRREFDAALQRLFEERG